jgi:hypothetical protein
MGKELTPINPNRPRAREEVRFKMSKKDEEVNKNVLKPE